MVGITQTQTPFSRCARSPTHSHPPLSVRLSGSRFKGVEPT